MWKKRAWTNLFEYLGEFVQLRFLSLGLCLGLEFWSLGFHG